MKNLIIAILSILFLAAFIPARWGTASIVHGDTTWKPYIVVLRNEYGQQTSKWVKGYYNPNLHGDTVATGKVAQFNFTNVVQGVTGWNDCVLTVNAGTADSSTFVPITDGATSFKLGIYAPSNWPASAGANNRGVVADDGGGYAFPSNVINSYWASFQNIGANQAFKPMIYVSGLDTTKLYRFQYLSSWYGLSSNDTLAYSCVVFQSDKAGVTDTTITGNPYPGVSIYRNTSKTVFSPFLKPLSGGIINFQFGSWTNPSQGWGAISGVVITEYKKE